MDAGTQRGNGRRWAVVGPGPWSHQGKNTQKNQKKNGEGKSFRGTTEGASGVKPGQTRLEGKRGVAKTRENWLVGRTSIGGR